MAATVNPGLETPSSPSEQTPDQQVPGPPASVLVSSQLQNLETFTRITQNMLTAVQNLEPANFVRCKDFLKEKLYGHLSEEKQPVLPDSPEDLMKHARQFYGPLNTGVLKLLAAHLSDSELKRLLTDYEKALPSQLRNAVWDSEAPVAAPQGYEIVVIKMQASLTTTVTKALEIKDVLGNMKSLKGSIVFLAGLGDSGTSIVFYIPVSAVFTFFQRMIHEKRYKTQLQQVGAQLVVIPDQASWDPVDGIVVYNSLDSIVDMQKVAKQCPEFGILVIGETGDGKSSLINSLLGVDVAEVGATTETKTVAVTAYTADIAGVPVAVYDTPGINAGEATSDKEVLDCIKTLNKDKKIHLTIFCFPLREVRLKANHTETLKAYQAAGVDWTSTIIALTFANLINAQTAPREVCENPNFDVAMYFKEKVQMWKNEIRSKLVADVGIPRAKADTLIIAPVTDDQLESLPDGENWFIPLWLDILELLPPAAYVRYLQVHQGKFSFTGETATIHLVGADAKRFQEIAERKYSDLKKAGIAAIGGVVAAGVAVASGIGGAAALIGISGALSFGIAIPLAAVGVVATVGVAAAIGGGVHFMRKYFRKGAKSD